MQKIILFKELAALSQKLHSEGKKIVLVGGCFDILHAGHIFFLQKAKLRGDVLIVLLEHDAHITELKKRMKWR